MASLIVLLWLAHRKKIAQLTVTPSCDWSGFFGLVYDESDTNKDDKKKDMKCIFVKYYMYLEETRGHFLTREQF